MNRLQTILTAITCITASHLHAQQKSQARQPNIIFIIADDLGYGNLTSYSAGSKIPTPNIDRLAKEGTRFTRFYAGNTVCAPSRCALMTGKTMGHAYIRGNGNAHLRPQDTTLAQRLQNQGYATGMFGKWGLGEEHDAGSPQLKGFDTFFGYLNQSHAHLYFTDHLFEVKNSQLREVKTDTTRYTASLIADHALDFISNNKAKPFFLYLPVTLPHAELLVPDSLMTPFRRADGSSMLTPEKPYLQKGGNYHSQPQTHAAFAAMVTELDREVGRVVQRVKDLGLDDNTYIFFTSDNGPHNEGGGDAAFFNSSGPLRGIKRDLYEGGIRVPLLVKAPGRIPAGVTSNTVWAFWDVLPTLCQLTGTPVPANIDGLSFLPTLTGKQQTRQHDYLYWQFNEGELREALMQGNWKLLRFKSKGRAEVLELYDIGSDMAEQHNMAAARPAKVKALRVLMSQAKTPAENPLFDWSSQEQ